MKRARINPISDRKRRQIRDEKAVRNAYKKAHPYCEAKEHICSFPDGIPGDCFGALQVHEPWQRGQGGPTDDPRNLRTVCAFHNTQISQDTDTRNWALFHGFSVKMSKAVEWFEAEHHECRAGEDCPFYD